MLEKLARLIDSIIGLISGALAAILLLYSGYVLYDNFNTNRNAFSSWDLLQYKPVEDLNEDEGFQELLAINPDVVGWLTVFDTNIDYPVLQGEDNMEYVNKDVYGNFSLSGAIYIAAECPGDFTGPYSLIYGHHMDNGAMFGGIDEFADPAYFQAHKAGLIQTTAGNYDLRAFACVKTDAYESLIYSATGKTYADLEDYIREHALTYDRAGAMIDGALVALSTCADIDTNGRLVLFGKLTRRTAPLVVDEDETEQTEQVRRRAVGHGAQNTTWALLNLVCAALTVYTLFPLGNLRVKYRQFGYSRRTARKLNRVEGIYRQRLVIYDLKRFYGRLWLGFLLEAALAAGAAYLFYRTEDIRRNMVILDGWTPVMIALFALALLIDFLCFRYRGFRPEEDEPQEAAPQETK